MKQNRLQEKKMVRGLMRKEVFKKYFDYIVSNNGKVVSLKRKKQVLMKQCVNHKGYYFLSLYINNKKIHFFVHRLVAIVFIPNLENKKQINHKNGNKKDNRVENLEWSTGQENMQHAFKNGLIKGNKGEKNGRSKIKEKTALKIKKMLETKSNTEIKKELGVSIGTIIGIKSGNTWKHIPNTHLKSVVKKANGEKHPKAKLKEKDVKKIKKMIKKGLSNTDISKMYGVHRVTISAIKTGKTWTHLK